MTQKSKQQGSPGTTALGVGAVALMVLCCVGPALLVGGGLAALGGFLSNPAVVIAGLVLLGAALIVFVRRHRGSLDQSCCPPDRNQDVDPTRITQHPPEADQH